MNSHRDANYRESIDFDDGWLSFVLIGRGLPPGLRFPAGDPHQLTQEQASGIMKNPILSISLSAVMRTEIALPLQHMLKLYTVGCLLKAWRSPRNHKSIEQLFDSPEQARHAVATCAAWLGVQTQAAHEPVPAWWVRDLPAMQTSAAAL
jgi:hypothetical protein